jgi:putative acetyltransferase
VGSIRPETLTIRRIHSTAQFAQLRELLVEYENSLPVDLRHNGNLDLRSLRIGDAAPNAAFLSLVDQNAAGCVALRCLDASTSLMQRLYVKPAYRQLGVARALVATAIQFSRDHQHRRIVLDTDRERLRAAYNLYVSLGFVQCEPYGSVDYACPTYMELRLH